MKKPVRPPPRKSSRSPLPPPFTGDDPRATPAEARFHFQLYVTGHTPRSTQAVANLRALCEEHLDGRYELEVIDLYQEPARAAAGQVIASPTLIKILPKPLMRMVGNLADRDQLRIKLDLADPLGGAACPTA
jgi:circadian clock protein KaiB